MNVLCSGPTTDHWRPVFYMGVVPAVNDTAKLVLRDLLLVRYRREQKNFSLSISKRIVRRHVLFVRCQ